MRETIRAFVNKRIRERITGAVVLLVSLSFVLGFAGGISALYIVPRYIPSLALPTTIVPIAPSTTERYEPQTSNEERVIAVVNQSLPSVVSVIATKDLPVIERFLSPFGGFFVEGDTTRQQVSAGTGFVAGTNLVVTNKHVVADTDADYTVVTTTGKRLSAEVIARDPIEDLAILKVKNLNLPLLPLGNSDGLVIGQTVLTIGNVLGEFENSVSLGVVSGLSRTITASSRNGIDPEVLREVIQTDAAINFGNSGGPLLNLSGEVIGVNVARAAQADNVGFAVPINRIKQALAQAEETGSVAYPFLGVRYTIITPDFQQENNLPVDYGALVERSAQSGQTAVVPGSAADRAGVVEGDILLEISNERITASNPLADIIGKYKVGDIIFIKLLRGGDEQTVQATLGERP